MTGSRDVVPGGEDWRPFFFRAQDGLKLFARDYGPRESRLTPLVCLAGLSRNSRDFDKLAAFANKGNHPKRRVLCLDYRGRGHSERDSDWRNYTPLTEMLDTLDLMAAAGVWHACLLGTSRGGLIAMAMAAARPTALAGVILNDIGPEIDPIGLARIISYIGKLPRPADWDQAGEIIENASGGQFPKLSHEDWRNQARKLYSEREDGSLVADYDPALAKGLAEVDLGQPLATMWPQFDALANMPLLAIRGANSDILTADTLEEMGRHHPSLKRHVVPDAGHAPLLEDDATLKQIIDFLREVDKRTG